MRDNKNKKFGFASLSIGIGLLFLFVLFKSLPRSNAATSTEFISPLAEAVHVVRESISPKNQPKSKNTTELLNHIKQILTTEKGVYSIYIYDLNTNKGFGINETTILTAASVNKIYILAALYNEAKIGALDLDRRITIQSKDIQDYGTGVIRYQGAGTSYSLKSLAQLLIEKSDNTAAFVLTSIIGEDRIQELVEGWGMTQTDIAMNKTSNQDIANMLIKMYRGEITDRAHTTEMIGFMDDSDFENRIPKGVPAEITVYHKIGNEVGHIHDVGIVEHPEKPYFIGVLTNDITDDVSAESKIAEISEITYEFMTK